MNSEVGIWKSESGFSPQFSRHLLFSSAIRIPVSVPTFPTSHLPTFFFLSIAFISGFYSFKSAFRNPQSAIETFSPSIFLHNPQWLGA